MRNVVRSLQIRWIKPLMACLRDRTSFSSGLRYLPPENNGDHEREQFGFG
jgi:hypothetical protein